MKRIRIKNVEYKGYLIKPTLTGFRVYRKGYYIDEYPTVAIARLKIDGVAARHQETSGKQREVRSAGDADETGQMKMF